MWIPPCPPSTPLSLHIWARLWRSEVNFMCLPRPLSTLLYEPGSLSVLELTDLVWLADQWSLGTQHLCLCSSGVTRVCHHAQGLNSGLHAFAALTMLTAWSTSPASLVLEIKPLNLSVWGMVMGVRDTLALTQRRLKQPHSCLTWARCLLSPLRFGLFIFKRNNIYNFSDNMSRRINATKKVALYNLCQL